MTTLLVPCPWCGAPTVDVSGDAALDLLPLDGRRLASLCCDCYRREQAARDMEDC